MLCRNWLIASGVCFFLLAIGATGFALFGKKSGRKLPNHAELIEMYPIPFAAKSAWALDRLDGHESDRGKTDATSIDLIKVSDALRKGISAHLQTMDENERLFMRFYASRLPYYTIAELCKQAPYMVADLSDHWILIVRETLRERVQEYVNELGGKDAFIAKHPKRAKLLDILQ